MSRRKHGRNRRSQLKVVGGVRVRRGVFGVKKVIRRAFSWCHGTKCEDDLVKYVMTGNDNIFGG